MIGSVPGMGDRDQTAFMARMLNLSSPKPTLVPLKSWRYVLAPVFSYFLQNYATHV